LLNCLFKEYFGYDCPGCGIQRAFLYLIKGDLEKSLILFPPLLLYIALLILLIFSVVFNFNISYKWFVFLTCSAVIIQFGYYTLRMLGVIHVNCYFE
jgi:hypothetical protein